STGERDLGAMASAVFEVGARGDSAPLIERIPRFAELGDGLKTLATGKVTGKLVVSLDI
ncbi:UNVERIFIED_CONTAM: alcohol dehydrogenase, partial [Bifidobacterium animalis]|nr:alcohol dehydrogenase [Bifidobacterium animalis]